MSTGSVDKQQLQADHIKPHSKSGPTNLSNGQMINGADNTAKSDTWNDEV